MSRVTMKAIDTLHLSSVGPDNIEPGTEFEVGETDAVSLEKRGLAERTGKAAPAPENKMDAAPENKTISADSVKAPAKRTKKGA